MPAESPGAHSAPCWAGFFLRRRSSEFLRSGKGERRGKGWVGEWEPDAGEGHVWSSSYLCAERSGEIYRNWFHLHTALRLRVRVFGVDAVAGRGGGQRGGEGPAALRAPRRVGFRKVVSHLACPSAPTSHPLSPHLPFPAPSPSTLPTPPPKSAELRFRL